MIKLIIDMIASIMLDIIMIDNLEWIIIKFKNI